MINVDPGLDPGFMSDEENVTMNELSTANGLKLCW